MAVSAADLNSYLRLAPDDTESTQMYLDAAKAKAQAAGVPDYENNAQYDLFLLALAANYYDNRGMTGIDTLAQQMINSFVLELRHSGVETDG
jgi:hypothetical protein